MSTAELLGGLDALLSGVTVGDPYNLSISEVAIHPIDMDTQFPDWSFHVTVQGEIDDTNQFGQYDDTLSCSITLYGQDATVNRQETSRRLWAFRDAIVADLEGVPGRTHLGPYCDSWMVSGSQELSGVDNGTAFWIALNFSLTIVRTIPYPNL